MAKNNYHIFGGKGNVSIKKEGASRATATGVKSRSQAYEMIKEMSTTQSKGAEVMIHDLHGRINVKNTLAPANDPYSIPG